MNQSATNLLHDGVAWCYRHLGWSFVPLAGKKPVQKGWQASPRESLKQALEWTSQGNVGLRTGLASGGVVVIDIDAGADVTDLQLPPTISAMTGGGGRHLYFRSDQSVRNSAGALCAHVDVRGDGGQVVFPGSVHPETGELYRWEEGCEPWVVDLAPLPQAILDRLTSKPVAINAKKQGERRSLSQRKSGGRLARFILHTECHAVEASTQGTRNDTLNKAAFTLGRLIGAGHLDRSEAENELLSAAATAGLEAREAKLTIASGLTAGTADPRELVERVPRSSGRGPSPSDPGVRNTSAPKSHEKRAMPQAETLPKAGTPAEPSAPLSGEPAPGTIDPQTGRLILSTVRTLPTAKSFVSQFYTHPTEGRTLAHYAGMLMNWQENRYAEAEDGAMRNQLLPWLHSAVRMKYDRDSSQWIADDFPANPNTVKAALDSIKAHTHLPAATPSPSWLHNLAGRPIPTEILPCRSSLLHLPTMTHLAPTPAYFTINALDYDPDPNAQLPGAWLTFLGELFGDDMQSWDLLQDWFGYCLTGDTSQHKMLLLVGPKRSGKGTIARVLARLVGAGNVAGPTTSSLAGAFGMQPLIGKSLAIVSDARFSGENIATVVERLLCISGEDTLTIDRKHLTSVTMKLPTRFVFLTNELPRLSDASGALAGRFMMLKLTESFYGREDKTLTDKLLAEIPGILNWAIEGWKRLRQRGHFVQPASVDDALRDMEDLSSPVGAFVRECCVVAPGQRVWVDELYKAWKVWCEQEGRSSVTTKQTFGRDLSAAVPGLGSRVGSGNFRFYQGIALRS